MGKGTIIQHQGEGLYRVKLVRSTLQIKSRIAAVDADLSDLQPQIDEAGHKRDAAAAALAAVRAATDAEITRINQQYSRLRQTIEDDQDAVDDCTEDVRRAQADVDYLKLLESQGVEVNEQQMADAELHLKDAEEALKAATAVLQADQKKWTERDQDLSAIEKNIHDAAEAAEAYRVADALHRDLVLKNTALQKEKAWLQSQDKPDPTVDAWCADLTTDLTGNVGTIEIPGERNHATDIVQIRPGFDGRAEYAAQEQFQNLIQAKREALDARNQAQQRIDATTLALENGRKRVAQLRAHLEALRARPPATADVYGYLQDLDGKPIAAPKGITEAEIVAAEGQLHAAEAQIPVLESRKATMATALTTAQATLAAATVAVENAQRNEQKPRNADGQLQPVAAATGPFSSFFNRALLPAWQKWRPMYRLGEITELAGDQATVKLDAAKSSQQGIDINRDPVLHQVPIRYMDCNGGAFQVGDRVIVEFAFHEQSRPAVIGFESHPRACRKSGFIVAIKARPAGSAHDVIPRRLGHQTWSPPPEQPDAKQPPSPYAPWGDFPEDADIEVYEMLAYRKEYALLMVQGTALQPKFRVTSNDPNAPVAWGNRRFHAWDGEKYLGCLSFEQKPAFGGEWLVRDATWAGPVITQGQTAVRTGDYMQAACTQHENLSFGHCDIVWQGRVLFSIRSVPLPFRWYDLRIAAACVAKRPATETTPERWVVRYVACGYCEIGPIVNEYVFQTTGRMVKPTGWISFKQFCRPTNVWFQVVEVPLDAETAAARIAAAEFIGPAFNVHPELWPPNVNDASSFDINYVDVFEWMRPDSPIGAFSADGSKCTILAFGGRDNPATSYLDLRPAVATCRLTFPPDGAPSHVWSIHYGEFSYSGTINWGTWYDETADTWRISSPETVSEGGGGFSGEVPMAVEYDGNEEVLGILRYSGVQEDASLFAGNASDRYHHLESRTYSFISTNGKVSASWTRSSQQDYIDGGFEAHNIIEYGLIHTLDMVHGFMGWTHMRVDYVSPADPNSLATSTRTVRIMKNDEVLYSATSVDPTAKQPWPVWGEGESSEPVTKVSSSGPDLYLDPSVGYLESYHYGIGPRWSMVVDQHGNSMATVAYNEWAPAVSMPGYRTAGGFVPNTSQFKLFWKTPGEIEQKLEFAKLADLDLTLYSLGFI